MSKDTDRLFADVKKKVLAEWGEGGYKLLKQVETLPSQHVFIFTALRGDRLPG